MRNRTRMIGILLVIVAVFVVFGSLMGWMDVTGLFGSVAGVPGYCSDSLMPPDAEGSAEGAFFETYGVNPFVETTDDAFSTFAVDVDTASYAIMRRYINDGHLPPSASVRTEEFVNYFEQGYEPPVEDTFAIHIEGGPSLFGDEGDQMVRVGLQGYICPAEARKDAVLTFVIDVSGSMDLGGRLDLVKETLRLLIEQLRPTDQVGIVVFGSRSRVILEHTPIQDSESILWAIDRLVPEGSTNAEEGLSSGYLLASESFDPEALNRVILCSDGVANVGETGPEAILAQVSEYAEQGITLATVGFGVDNYHDVLMEQLADNGNGLYAYIDTLSEAERVFGQDLVSTLQVIALDAKVQVEFNPAVVSRYRLLGYENRALEDEAFEDDQVDAGEIGAGHSVTALYEITLLEGGSALAEVLTVRLRYQDPDTAEVVELSRSIAQVDFATTFEGTSARFRLAAVVAEYAEILRESPWAEGSSLEDVLLQARRVAEGLNDDADVVEFANLVEEAERLTR